MLEDSFSNARPPLEDAGVQIVADVEPYELMKLRMLNASHQALCYPGRLVGYRLVHEVTSDPLFARFLLDYMLKEAIPTLKRVPRVDLGRYAHELIERFANPEVRDTVARPCANIFDLIPKFPLPVVKAQLAAGRSIVRSVAVIAFWARSAEGIDERGDRYAIDDALEPRLRAAAARQQRRRLAFLEDNSSLFGDLADNRIFTGLYVALLRSLHERGVRHARRPGRLRNRDAIASRSGPRRPRVTPPRPRAPFQHANRDGVAAHVPTEGADDE